MSDAPMFWADGFFDENPKWGGRIEIYDTRILYTRFDTLSVAERDRQKLSPNVDQVAVAISAIDSVGYRTGKVAALVAVKLNVMHVAWYTEDDDKATEAFDTIQRLL